MAERLYYNQSTYDANTGAGYGRLTPRFHTDKMKQSGWPYIDDDERDEFDPDEIDSFVKTVNIDIDQLRAKLGYRLPGDPSKVADRGALTKDMGQIVTEADRMPATISGMVPFPAKSLYGKFDGDAAGGFSTSAAYTTGPYGPSGIRTGTLMGTAKAPFGEDPEEEFNIFNLDALPGKDILPMLRQRLKAMRVKSHN